VILGVDDFSAELAVRQDGPMQARAHRDRRWDLAHYASLVVILAVCTISARGEWFFGDEWDFLVFRGIRGAHRFGLLRPHNEHWSTIPILLWRAIFAFVGIKSYWPYMGLLFAAHLLAVHFLWRILRRIPGIPPALAVAGAAVLGLYGAGWEDLLWAFQIGFIGSLVFGLGLVLAVDEVGGRRRVAGVAVGAVLSLMMSGLSVVMVGVVGLVAFARWGWRKALAVTVPAGITYVIWLERYGPYSLDEQNQYRGTIGDIPRYVVGGIGGTLGDAVHRPHAGTIPLVLLVAGTIVFARRWYRIAPEVLAMFIGAIAMYAVISQGRGALPEPAISRYLYISAGLIIPVVALLLATLAQRWVATRVAVVVGAVALCVTGATRLYDQSKIERVTDLSDRGQYVAALALADSGIPIISDQPQQPFNPDVTIEDLRSLRARGKDFTQPINDRDKTRAQLALQVGAFDTYDRPLGDTSAGATPQVTVRPLPHGCANVDAHGTNLIVNTKGRSAFTVRYSKTAQIELYLPFDGGYAGPRHVALAPHATRTIVSDLVGQMVVQLPPGFTKVCGISWSA
jgi:hypothetical protein